MMALFVLSVAAEVVHTSGWDAIVALIALIGVIGAASIPTLISTKRDAKAARVTANVANLASHENHIVTRQVKEAVDRNALSLSDLGREVAKAFARIEQLEREVQECRARDEAKGRVIDDLIRERAEREANGG